LNRSRSLAWLIILFLALSVANYASYYSKHEAMEADTKAGPLSEEVLEGLGAPIPQRLLIERDHMIYREIALIALGGLGTVLVRRSSRIPKSGRGSTRR